MISSFNIGKLTSLLQNFHTVTRLRITVFDENFCELASYPAKKASCCQLIREDTEALAMCLACDEHACKKAAKKHDTYIYQCHAGFHEAIVPIYLSNLIIGYLFFGHVLSYPDYETGWKAVSKSCSRYQVDMDRLKNAFYNQPLISEDYIRAAAGLLDALASYLCMERLVTLRHENLPVQIDNYIQTHLTETINAKIICEHFKIGKTRLYAIAKESYGIGIAERIRNGRIEKAKSLLLDSPELSINEVASLCGFHDYNYFITVFKRLTGLSPKQFSNSLPAP